MTEQSRTAAATRARMRASEDKTARKLQERGWFCHRTGEPFQQRDGLQVYATNGMCETYRVIGWANDGLPILSGGDGREFLGVFGYLFTIGPE